MDVLAIIVLLATLAIPVWTTVRWRGWGVPIGALLTWGIGYAYWMRDRQEDPGIDFNFMLPMWVGCGWVGTLTYALVVYGIVQAIRGSAERNQREPTVVEPGNQPPPYMPAAPNQGDEPTNHPH